MNVEDLRIKVTYRVGLGNVEIPKKVYNQLLLAADNWKEIDDVTLDEDYKEAADWLRDNIREADCMNWVAEVDAISEHKTEN